MRLQLPLVALSHSATQPIVTVMMMVVFVVVLVMVLVMVLVVGMVKIVTIQEVRSKVGSIGVSSRLRKGPAFFPMMMMITMLMMTIIAFPRS